MINLREIVVFRREPKDRHSRNPLLIQLLRKC